MGIWNDVKRLFFVKKSVAGSAGKKVADQSKETFKDLKEEAQAAWEKAKDVGEDVLDRTADKIDQIVHETDLDQTLEKAKAFTRKMTGSTDERSSAPVDSAETTGDNIDKSDSEQQEWIEKAGYKAAELGHSAKETFKEVSEKVGKKAMDLSEEIADKARDLAGKIDEKLSEISEKAEKMRREEASEDKKWEDSPTRHDENPDLTSSTLEGKDDFFAKAEKFASGKPMEPVDKPIPSDPTGVDKPVSKAYGFEDLDGDGNEIIDDAIIDEATDENEQDNA